MGIVTPTPPVMGKLLFYCAAWLYLPPLCRASGSRLSLACLSLPRAFAFAGVVARARDSSRRSHDWSCFVDDVVLFDPHFRNAADSSFVGHSTSQTVAKNGSFMVKKFGVLVKRRRFCFLGGGGGGGGLFVFPFLFLRSCGTIACCDRARNKIIETGGIPFCCWIWKKRAQKKCCSFLFFFFFWACCFCFFVWVFGFLSPHGLRLVLLCFLETGFGGTSFQNKSIRKMISYLG